MSAKNRILHFIESGGIYGAERVILNLSQETLRQEKYSPILGCIVNKITDNCELHNFAIELGLESHKIPIRHLHLISDISNAAKTFQSLNISLIHSHGYKPSVFGFFIRHLTAIPIIATCHSIPQKGPLKMRVMVWIEKKLYRFFPKVIAVSEPIKASLEKHKISKEKIEIIKNGVHILENPISKTAKNELRLTLGINNNDFCVLNIGRLVTEKAQWTFIQAAKLLKDNNESVKILIAGDGPLRHELEQLIEKENVGEYVCLLGFRDDGNNLLAICNAFAMTSVSEGMPMGLLEAASANRPIITTLVGDIGKLITHNQTGYVIEKESPKELVKAIIRLKNDAELRIN